MSGIESGRDLPGAVVQDFDEPAQVRALDARGAGRRTCSPRRWCPACLLAVQHGDRVADAGDADLIDRQVPVIAAALDVFEHQAASPR